MRLAFVTDIHGNREGFSAVLDDLADRRIDRMALLGDVVGYGPDPEWCVDRVIELVDKGALAVRGNHDQAINDPSESMNSIARIAIDWTRPRLSKSQRDFLGSLPLTVETGDIALAHASLNAPEAWMYITDDRRAVPSFRRTTARLIACGHTHVPTLISHDTAGIVRQHQVPIASPVPLLRSRRWLVVIGSAGQPRDGSPAAGYAIYDSATNEFEFRRVPYDVGTTVNKIRAAGLPEPLAMRVQKGS
jgi:diadenosine tetraphosphatase ApaH/serine/threonine PP2A family protein phosphatase